MAVLCWHCLCICLADKGAGWCGGSVLPPSLQEEVVWGTQTCLLYTSDPKLAQDVEFAKLAKAVHDKHVYAAQHFAHDYQVRLAHQVEVLASHRPLTDHTMESSAHRHLPDDGLPHVDAMA